MRSPYPEELSVRRESSGQTYCWPTMRVTAHRNYSSGSAPAVTILPAVALVVVLAYLLSYGAALRLCLLPHCGNIYYLTYPKWMSLYRPIDTVVGADFRSHLGDRYGGVILDCYRSYLRRCDSAGAQHARWPTAPTEPTNGLSQ